MTALDPRLHAIRPDAADRALAGEVDRPRYLDPVAKVVSAASASLRREPRPDSRQDTELLHGERVKLFEETPEGWAWVQSESDGYVGWCPAGALETPGPAPTHRVAALRTWVYPGPDLKMPPLMLVSLNSEVAVLDLEGDFARIPAGFVFARHLRALDDPLCDWVAVAERFVGTPYYWGGRTSLGLDCSALVQMAMGACGLSCPRDSDMQERTLGAPVEPVPTDGWRRGDLVFWKGHVAIALGDGRLLHANGHHMDTVIEPAGTVVERILAKEGCPVSSVRRV
ncbi:C40 family peptidase [Lutibaculum baratangense]|uniref:NLP/P60 family lipoprotein n=1 Tax=Lutibaculum baratangense AMV1 TaxID=631454 RepID=V4RD27_9HYPH|nr:C40 family peptidase [Lutibaculum baratangense]ESR24051.1 NLP/P60 family lipoprotein [Lutibaculum baratangense AMV1]